MTKPVIRKESPPKVNAAENPKTLKVDRLPSESIADAVAHAALRLTVQAALTVREYTQGFGEMSINALVGDLVKQCVLASSGDLKRAEATLTAQAHTLDAIFHYLARRAQSAEHLSQQEIYLRLGLKSQSQSRATLETLAAIKNPAAVAFVRQANIAHGPQQVNNGVPPPLEASRARESENSPNKLLEQQRNEWMDAGATQAAGRADPALEAVDAVHGTKDDRR